MKKFLVVALGILSLFLAPPAHAAYFDVEDKGLGPLDSRGSIPLLYMFYTMPVQRAETMGRNKFEFRTQFDLSSIYEEGISNQGSLSYDMELYRTSFHFEYGILENLDVHLEIPTISFGDGFLDGFVNSYHEAFNFEDGGRKNTFDDQYRYNVNLNGRNLYSFTPVTWALSDINMDLKWRVLKDESWWPALALRAGVKFPTGDFNRGTGSGEFDYGFGLALSKAFNRLHLFAGFDASIVEDPQSLRDFIDEEIFHYFGGFEFVLIRKYLSAVIQVDGQSTPFIHTGMPQLDNEVLDIVPGFKGSIWNEHIVWQAALREDLIPDSTNDFTASFGLSINY